MNKKRIIIAIVILLLGAFAVYFYFINKEESSDLSADEKQWIDDNRNRLIDFGVPTDVPVLSAKGEGVIFDFLNALEEDTDLEFNLLSYEDEASGDYNVKLVNKVSDNEILLYQDNYVLVTLGKINYVNASDIKNINIGLLEENTSNAEAYLESASNIKFTVLKNTTELINALSNKTVDAIILPKLEYLNNSLETTETNIAYNITEYTQSYVISLGDNDTLNNILNKYYKKWSRNNFASSFNNYLLETYFDAKEIDESDQVGFRSKRYTYGFVLNSPFDVKTNNGLGGFNYNFTLDFADCAGIEINYKRYSSIKNLVDAFNNGELDIIFNNNDVTNYKVKVNNTISVFDEKVSIITDDVNTVINSVNSLDGKEVLTVDGSKIDAYLKEKGVKTKTYNNVDSLINHLSKKTIAAIDSYSYDYFVRNDLADFKEVYSFTLDDDYNYLVRDIKANEVLYNYFDFYLMFTDNKTIMNESYTNLLNNNSEINLIQILIVIGILLVLLLLSLIIIKLKKRKKDHNLRLSKTEKLRYVDGLTSLKNRNYLNDSIKSWDESDIYPQSIIIVDLNNIAYINDNFGHAEGDKVIIEAAGILINHQLPNSEIIRTSGNEFLIFVLGKEEKEIISYIRKLNKEFKNLTHGFSAAIGYSIIVDEIKTIDDAINEATIAMRHNKDKRNG